VREGRNEYIWLGTSRTFGSFSFPFVLTKAGWIWAHAYGFEEGASTFIVETTPETWHGLCFDRLGPEDTLRTLEEIFATQLDGHALRLQPGIGGKTPWLHFQRVTNNRWHAGNLALMGDAAHTTHFTIGSGTRLALQDAMRLVDALAEQRTLSAALEDYGVRRKAELRRVQQEAAHSARWFESVDRYLDRGGDRFAELLLARRSVILPFVPPRGYLRLTDVASSVPSLDRRARTAIARLGSLPR
jgi:anthraniloyl-CoA monooxygenase